MKASEKKEILEIFEARVRDSLIESHKKNTLKLNNLKPFKINRFLWHYLAAYLEGNTNPKSLAKVLVYPRVLGTSITTSFGVFMQGFLTDVLSAYGSTTSGIDIEFIGRDGRKKYCQLKSGPDAINRDDVKTIKDHFKGVINLAKTNKLKVDVNDMLFCVLYGEPEEKNTFMSELEKDYTVLVGNEFWTEFTNDESFYDDLIDKVSKVAKEVNMKSTVDQVINDLALDIKKIK